MLSTSPIKESRTHEVTTVEQPSTSAAKYRKDIDALRGISILSVFIYHLFPNIIPGGFIGVDIFFVISGYLISSIIFTELESNSFSFINFYIRRIKRIFPALIVVSILFYSYGFFVLFPDEFSSFGRHLGSSSLFLSNLTLYREIGYFDLASEYKPLLHLWSLAVEEQFYLLWPTILWLSFKISKKSSIQNSKKKIPITIIVIITLLSFSANIYLNLIENKNNLAFYFTGSRLWEMSLGSLAAIYFVNKKINLSKLIFEVLVAFCFLIILASIFSINHSNKYLPFLIVAPLLSVLFLLIFHRNIVGELKLGKILHNQTLIFVGLVSYPMYLLHWPLISFSKIINGEKIDLWKASLIFLTVILSSFTIYKYIERPIRKMKSNFIVLFLCVLLSIAGILGFCSYVKIILPYVSYKIPESINVTNSFDDWNFPTVNMKKITVEGEDFYKIGDSGHITLFFGDSNAEQYAPYIDKLVTKTGNLKSAVFATRGGLCPLPNVGRSKDEIDFVNKVMKYALFSEVKEVVITGQWASYLGGTARNYLYSDGNISMEHYLRKAIRGFKNFIFDLTSSGKKVYIISSIPYGLEYGPKRFFSRSFTGNWTFQPKHADRYKWDNFNFRAKNILLEISEYSGAIIINPEIFLCKNDYCLTSTEDGLPIYKDEGHLAANYVKNHISFLDFLFLS